ncbi:MAG TPA: putative manganese transporter [Clostridia bacterium]|nr:putative manganese transporter [Clostridia bacterium]
MVEILIDSIKDTIKAAPVMFAIFLLTDVLINRLGKGDKLEDSLLRYGYFGGALLGAVPQCGISVAFAKLYSSGHITLGMLVAVFISGSDEALVILGAQPGMLGTAFMILGLKVLLAIATGFAAGKLIKEKRNRIKSSCGIGCTCPKCARSGSLVVNNLIHTAKIMLFLILTVFVINLAVESLGEEAFAAVLGKNNFMQPVFASLIGMIPSCFSSILVAEAYASGAIGFGALIAGLCANTGYGILIIFQKLTLGKALKIMVIVQAISIFIGEIIFIFWS